MGMISIRRPTTVFDYKSAAPTYDVNRPIKGLRVGIRTDQFWHSWLQITEEWCDMLRKDGAEPVIFRVGEHVGVEGDNTRKLLDEWADSVDCAVVGLAN